MLKGSGLWLLARRKVLLMVVRKNSVISLSNRISRGVALELEQVQMAPFSKKVVLIRAEALLKEEEPMVRAAKIKLAMEDLRLRVKLISDLQRGHRDCIPKKYQT